MKRSELSGKTFGKLRVLELSHLRTNRTYWKCVCECGKETIVSANHLQTGNTKSCGCLTEKHGHYKWHKSPTYYSWNSMIQRCTNPNNEKWHLYGGRGITVCERWKDFRNFLEDMGERPKGKTIDRRDSNGNYEPNNCRWATPKEQFYNIKNLAICVLLSIVCIL